MFAGATMCFCKVGARGKHGATCIGHAENMDTLGIEPRASRMLSGCDTTTPRALDGGKHRRCRLRPTVPPDAEIDSGDCCFAPECDLLGQTYR